MISIKRGECPAVLNNASSDGNTYRDSTVIEALSKMQHGKCCYCEKRIVESGHDRAVEHFRPQGNDAFRHLKNTWSNLLHACAGCNGKKAAHFPLDANGDALLIDPSDPAIDPEDHLDFNVNDDDINFGRILPKDASEFGAKTIETIGLDLVARREERYSGYADLYRAFVEIKVAKDELTRQQKVRAFESRLGANNEHAAFARAFARWKQLDSKFGVRICKGANTEPE